MGYFENERRKGRCERESTTHLVESVNQKKVKKETELTMIPRD